MNPFDTFAEIVCLNLDSRLDRWWTMQPRFRVLGIAPRIRRFPAIETPDNHHIGCALSFRAILQDAADRNLPSLLVIEDDAIFLDRTHHVLARALPELAGIDWLVCYLGGMRWHPEPDRPPGTRFLRIAEARTCTHAIAFNRPFYPLLLDALPSTPAAMAVWAQSHHAIDQFQLYLEAPIRRRFVAVDPSVATQPQLLPSENPADRARFVI